MKQCRDDLAIPRMDFLKLPYFNNYTNIDVASNCSDCINNPVDILERSCRIFDSENAEDIDRNDYIYKVLPPTQTNFHSLTVLLKHCWKKLFTSWSIQN